jgi:hypothetical protein
MDDSIDYTNLNFDDMGIKMTVITIVLQDNCEPQIDLSSCDPATAATIFRQAATMLEDMNRPTIIGRGEVLEEEYIVMFSDDEDYE